MQIFVKFLQNLHLNSILRAFWWDFGVEMEPDSIRKMNEANGAFAPCQGRNTYRHNMPDNKRCNCRQLVGAKEESSRACE